MTKSDLLNKVIASQSIIPFNDGGMSAQALFSPPAQDAYPIMSEQQIACLSHVDSSQVNKYPDTYLGAMYRTLVTYSSDAIVYLDNHSRFRYANEAALNLFRFTNSEELSQHSLAKLLPQAKRQSFLQLIQNLQADGEVRIHTLSEVQLGETTARLEMAVFAFMHNGLKLIQVAVKPPSQVSLHKLKQEQFDASQLDLFRRLIARLADKTLNPLTVIDGFITLLKERDMEVNLDILSHEVNQIRQTWSELVAIAQTEISPGDLDDTLSSILK